MVGLLVYLLVAVWCFRARGLSVLAMRATRLVCLYGFIAYFLRGLQLMIAQPVPRFGDPIPIPMLFSYGYTSHISQILLLEALGLLCTCLGIRAVANRRQSETRRWNLSPRVGVGLLIAYCIGLLGRLPQLHRVATIRAGAVPAEVRLEGSPLAKLTFLCFVVVALVLLSKSWWEAGSLGRRLVVVLGLSELVWSFLGSTKTPALGLAVGLYLSWPSASERGQRVGPPLPRPAVLAGVLVLVVASFSLINAYRRPSPDLGTVNALSFWSVAGAELRSPLGFTVRTVGRVAARLDGLRSASDAMVPTRQPYISWGHYGTVAAQAIVPASLLGVSKENPSYLWATVMAQSDHLVALSETTPAEGYAMGGITGLIGSCLLLGLAIGAASRMVDDRRRLLQFGPMVAVAFLTSPALVERGLLGVWVTVVNLTEAGAMILVLVTVLGLGADTRQMKAEGSVMAVATPDPRPPSSGRAEALG